MGFNAKVLLRELRVLGYQGSGRSVRRYVRRWREAQRLASAATVRFETQPGEQAQLDWGSTRLWLGEEPVRVHLFVMVLGYSRRLFVRGYLHERLGALLDGHTRALAHWGGCPTSILYDNPRTIVKSKGEAAGKVEWNPTFKDRLDFYGISPKLCRYYRAQTKGKVKSGVKYVKRNALAGRRFRDLEDLNTWLLEWCVTVADQRVHGTTHERHSVLFARAEAEALAPLQSRTPPPQERHESRIVPRDGYVAIDSNRYPVPLAWVGRRVEVQILAEEVRFRRDGQEAVCHPRLAGKHLVARWRGAPRGLPRGIPPAEGPPRFHPAFLQASGTVEARSLALYEALSEEAHP